MQAGLQYKNIIKLIENNLQLPSPPAIAVNILSTVRKDEAPLTALGDVIAKDPALTAKMLKIANSGMFCSKGNIANIQRAMIALGTDVIKNIALSFVITSNCRSTGNAGFNMDRFWQQSVAAAVAAELLARAVNQQNDSIFVTALLQDIGILVISQAKGDIYNRLIREVNDNDNLVEAENNLYGYNHAQVGYALLKHWNLPDNVCEPILYHVCPDRVPEESQQTTRILHFATQIASLCHDYGALTTAPALQEQLENDYGLTDQQTYRLLDEAATKSNEIIEFFEIKSEQMVPYSVLLQQANAELTRINLTKEQMVLELNVARTKSERMTRQLQESNARLRELVYRDGLTGLYNHRYFHETLDKELSRARRYHSSLSLIIFDIDYFKKTNDRHGHPVGDVILMNIAKAVCSAVRPCDIVARYGGDEFAIILPETGAEGARVFASRLRRCVEGIATNHLDQVIYVTMSAGLTTTTPETNEVTKDELILATDQALMLSKSSGRNQISSLDMRQIEN
jgi:diguanylate cyclase (GGDEF)-like protein